MIKKIIFFVLFFYFLALMQTGFLVHFRAFGVIPNLILIVLILINLLEGSERKLGLVAGLIAGFYLDVFSLDVEFFFGFYILICFALSLFIKFTLKRYVQIPVFKGL